MADTDEWGGIPVSTQPQADEWGGIPVNQPKLPDLSGVQKTVQQNIAQQQEGEGEQKTQTTQQKLDTAAGMPVSSQLNGSGAPISPEMRGHLVDSYKAGTASNGGDFMQSALLAVAPIMQIGEAARGIGARALGTLAFPFLSEDNRQKLIDSGDLGKVPSLTGGQTHDAIANTLTRANALLSPGLGAAYTLPASLLSPIISPALEGINKAVGVKDTSNVPAAEEFGMNLLGMGAGKFVWDHVPGAEALKETVGQAIGKDPAQVTSADIDQTIAKSYDHVPAAQDFHDVATVMGVEADSLHNIYKETGVKPDQVFEDAKSNPEIAKDVQVGKIPDAYDHLIDTRPPIPDDIQKIIDNYDSEEKTNESGPTSKEYAKNLYDKLHEKLGQDTATDIQSMQRELAAKDELGRDLDEKFYLKKEDENVKLSEEEQKLYDEHIKPLSDQERALYEKARTLSGEPIEPSSESYVHRIARGKGHYLDKYDTEFGSDENVGFGTPQRSLSQTTGSLKEAEFHALQDAEGNRQLQIGKIPEGYKAGDKYVDDSGKEWTIKRAKTEEIEKNTDLQYHKSAIGNTEDNIRKLEKTVRNIEFLNGLKGDMKETGLGVAPDAAFHPQDYKPVNIPQLRGWSFDPRVAEVLNDIYDRGGDSMLGRINNFLIKGMFLNPIPHIENVFYDYLASRGWKNANLVKGADYITQGIKDVKEFTPDYIDALKNGAALKLPAVWKGEFFNQLQRQFLKEAQSSKEGLDLAKSWGFDSFPSFAQSIFNGAQKALWGSGDAFLMAKIHELKDSGMSTPEAIQEAQRHIVDYRIPPRVGENILGSELSRMLSKTLQGNAVVVFTRYHYGLFKSLGNMVKDTVSGVASGDKAKTLEAAGQLFSTFFLLSVVNPLISNIWSSAAGQKEKVRRPGITGLVGAITDLISGKKNLGDALGSQAIVSPGIQAGADILKDKIVNPDLGHKTVQLMDYLMKQPSMAIPSIAYNIREGKQSASEEALRQIGVTPDKQYQKRKPSRKSINKLEKEEQSLLGENP